MTFCYTKILWQIPLQQIHYSTGHSLESKHVLEYVDLGICKMLSCDELVLLPKCCINNFFSCNVAFCCWDSAGRLRFMRDMVLNNCRLFLSSRRVLQVCKLEKGVQGKPATCRQTSQVIRWIDTFDKLKALNHFTFETTVKNAELDPALCRRSLRCLSPILLKMSTGSLGWQTVWFHSLTCFQKHPKPNKAKKRFARKVSLQETESRFLDLTARP